jgi:hypothetical protein
MKTQTLKFVALLTVGIIGITFGVRMLLAPHSPYSPPRPSNIPSDAVYIQGPDGHGLWESCNVSANEIDCKIANVTGSLLHDGRFIPYNGTVATTQKDIVITQKSGEGWISLANGTYLIPAENNEASKRYLNFMVGNAKHF